MGKTKKSKAAKQTQLLMDKAALRKLFFANLKKACQLFVGPDFYGKFTPRQLEEMYSFRVYGFKVKEANGHRIPKRIYNEISYYVPKVINGNSLPMAHDNGQMPLDLYYVEGLTLLLYIRHLKEDSSPNVRSLKEPMAPYELSDANYLTSATLLNNCLLLVGILWSDLRTGFYYAHHELNVSSTLGRTFNTIYLFYRPLEQRSVMLDGSMRPVTRVSWVFPGEVVQYSTIKPSDLHLPIKGKDIPMDVYIQSHALHRMEERIGVTPGHMHFFLHVSFHQPVCHIDHNGRLLIEYRLVDKKIGYLVASVQGDILVILTFLFLTNNGTPEGKKLAAITGLNKQDKQYLAIDKLRSFVASDIKENETIKNLFIESGCSSLFEFDPDDLYFLNKKNETNGEMLMKYLDLGGKECE